jgi:hypothetical protein
MRYSPELAEIDTKRTSLQFDSHIAMEGIERMPYFDYSNDPIAGAVRDSAVASVRGKCSGDGANECLEWVKKRQLWEPGKQN